MPNYERLSRHTDEVSRQECITFNNVYMDCVLAYNKDLEHGLNHRILSKDFKRILISMIQVRKEKINFHLYYFYLIIRLTEKNYHRNKFNKHVKWALKVL